MNVGSQSATPNVGAPYLPENVARQYGVTREAQDEWALRSHRRALAARTACRFSEEIVAIDVAAGRGETERVAHDEGPREDTSLEKLARLRPAFARDGTVTVGNSSQLSDGACALLLMSLEQAAERGLQPLARFVNAATAGVDPSVMGLGPIPATRKLLRKVGLTAADLDVVEVNEAFASQVIACIKDLELDEGRVNPNGGSIALGHPLGASGARLVTTLVRELSRRGARFGLATMCIGVGQGITALFERPPS